MANVIPKVGALQPINSAEKYMVIDTELPLRYIYIQSFVGPWHETIPLPAVA